jgi:hypothetical protein
MSRAFLFLFTMNLKKQTSIFLCSVQKQIVRETKKNYRKFLIWIVSDVHRLATDTAWIIFWIAASNIKNYSWFLQMPKFGQSQRTTVTFFWIFNNHSKMGALWYGGQHILLSTLEVASSNLTSSILFSVRSKSQISGLLAERSICRKENKRVRDMVLRQIL